MVQPSRPSLLSLTALARQQPSPLPASLASRLAIALQSFHPSSGAPSQIPWSAFHPILRDVLQALPSGPQKDEFRSLLGRIESEMQGEDHKEDVLSHQAPGSGMVEMKSNGLLPPSSPGAAPGSADTTAKAIPSSPPPQDQVPEVEIPPNLLPLILSALTGNDKPDHQAQKSLDNVTLLTTLALQPTLILPPGKTLASLLSASGERKRKRRVSSSSSSSSDDGRDRPGHGVQALEVRVGAMMKKAFWDDAAEKLMGPVPQPSLRVALLQTDLVEGFKGLIPPGVLGEVFEVPSQEARWERGKFAEALKKLLSAAKARCAPVRDDEVSGLSRKLEASLSSEGGTDRTATEAILEVVQGILELAEGMKSDLQTFHLLSIPPTSLPSLVASLARTYEHTTISSLFPSPLPPLTTPLPTLLVQHITSPHPISLPSPTPNPNTLLPYLIGTSRLLFHLQNQVQAVLITACLGAISPVDEATTNKIYALLMADLHAPGSEEHTHLDDLTLLLLSQPGRPDGEDEGRVRAAVGRVLRTEDPVWGLLVKRLAGAVLPLVEARKEEVLVGVMRTGLMGESGTGESGKEEVGRVKVKGFEGETLEKAVGEVVDGLRRCEGWVKGVWGVELGRTTAVPMQQGGGEGV